LKLSVVIIAFNSEKTIADAVKSALFADEILILDSGSDDKTVDIVKNFGARVEYQKWLGFGIQKQRAVDLAENDWVFVLDSDERITDVLKNEILSALQKADFDGYLIPRLNYFFGKAIRYCGLYPDYTVRLFDRNQGCFTNDDVHERVIMKGRIGTLKNHLIHHAYNTVEEFIDKQNRYSTLSSKSSKTKALVAPFWTFLRIFCLKLGFLDGWHGFVIAKLYSQYTFWKYIK